MSRSPIDGEESAADQLRRLLLPQRNRPGWAYGRESELYVVVPEVEDKDLPDALSSAQQRYGVDNVVVAEVLEENRLLTSTNHPGAAIYATAQGLAYAGERGLHSDDADAMDEVAALRQLEDRIDVIEKVVEKLIQRKGLTRRGRAK
jgi:hypothetical protein